MFSDEVQPRLGPSTRVRIPRQDRYRVPRAAPGEVLLHHLLHRALTPRREAEGGAEHDELPLVEHARVVAEAPERAGDRGAAAILATDAGAAAAQRRGAPVGQIALGVQCATCRHLLPVTPADTGHSGNTQPKPQLVVLHRGAGRNRTGE